MKRVTELFIHTFISTFLLTAAGPTLAQENQEGPPGNIAEIWTVHVKPEAQAAFEEAVREHMPLRKGNDEPFNWQTFMNNTGDSMATYYFRACCFAWADRDGYDTWSAGHPQVDEHWSANVHPHVAVYEHHFDEIDFANSHWPAEGPEPKFVGVTTYKIAPGAFQAVEAAKSELSQIALNQGWASDEHQWGWLASVDGPPTISLVIPFTDYADMAAPDPTFFEFLSEKLGADGAADLFGRFSAGTKGSRYDIYTHRPDLSTPD